MVIFFVSAVVSVFVVTFFEKEVLFKILCPVLVCLTVASGTIVTELPEKISDI
jgi:hypothetical protein